MAKVTEEMIQETAVKKTPAVKPHKCILTWNEDCILRLFVAERDGARIYKTIYPGHNTVDYEDVLDIYKNNKSLFNQIYNGDDHIKFKGIEFYEDENGETAIREGWTLAKTTANDFAKLIANTVSREALADLSNPDYVSVKYVDIADKKMKELEEFTGYQSDGSEE